MTDWFSQISDWKDEDESCLGFIGEFLYIGNPDSAKLFGLHTLGWHRWNKLLYKYEPYDDDFKHGESHGSWHIN